MYIKSVSIKNYKSHADTYVEFTNDLICIKGENGHGKSNLIDAIQLVVFNEPLPADDIRHGETSCVITVERCDGRRIRRTRKGASQEVLLLDADGEEYYKSTNVKQADSYVEEFFGFRKVTLDKNDDPYNLNFIPLGAPPFLIGKSAEKIMRSLSAVLAGRGVETSKVNLGKALNEQTREQKVDERLLLQCEERIAALNNPQWQKWKEKFQKLEAQETGVAEDTATIAFLEQVREQKKAIPFTAEEREAIKEAVKQIEELATAGAELKELDDAVSGLVDVRNSIQSAKASAIAAKRERLLIEKQIEELGAQLKAFTCETCERVVTVHQ